LDGGCYDNAVQLVAELVDVFDRHRAKEEAGLFCQLHQTRDADAQLDRLCDEDEKARAQLAGWETSVDPGALRQALGDLMRHAEVEDADLFPFAMQYLPGDRWELVEQVHQRLLFS
jgi:hemerythrin-like domain-containing protein